MNVTPRKILSGMKILIEGEWLSEHALVIEESLIKVIIPQHTISHHLPATHFTFSPHDYLVPGFIDQHVHGVNGFDVMDGTEQALQAISHALAAEGVTGFLATTMTDDVKRIEKVLTLIPTLMPHVSGAAILGIHLEGPFIAGTKMGAQARGKERLPNIALMLRWQKLAQNTIKIVTLAPELEGAKELIETLVNMNVIASIGHTNATYAETCKAIAQGAKQATHLFNAMRGLHQREPGAVGAILLDSKVNAEMIVDGLHLHPGTVELIWRLKGKDHLFLVTDAMRAKCMGDGQYDLGGQAVNVTSGKAVLNDGTLAGSTLKMPQAIKNMMKFSHCSLAEAIYLATENPARALGLDKKGRIAVGKEADLVVLDENLQVKLTMRSGREIFQA